MYVIQLMCVINFILLFKMNILLKRCERFLFICFPLLIYCGYTINLIAALTKCWVFLNFMPRDTTILVFS